ncbi:hypothetical protein [Catenuloplanes japonicus]|uniref:hypothetical protein n=1 Tax=Catenuloplanes japonicus TaxID=33876 RepID=UPI000525C287|nr:hypothetical protein [Catenuloplanes japonicus]
MPRARVSAFARLFRTVTGESHARALQRLRADPVLMPAASAMQASLEYSVLKLLGRRGETDGHGWRPGDDPFGISWVSPSSDALDIGVKLTALPDVLGALMPTYRPDDEPRGLWGLRAQLLPHGVQLRRLGLPGVIRLAGIRPAQWWRAAAAYLDTQHEPRDMQLLWLTHPQRMHPEEESFAHQFGSGYTTETRFEEPALLASVLLRRHMVFRHPSIAAVDLWQNWERIELEWADGPDHATVIDTLLDPVLGVPGVVSGSCHCTSGDRCWSIELTTQAAPGAVLNLRRCRYGWSEYRERSSDEARVQRHAALRRHWGCGPGTLAATPAAAR